MPNESYRLSPQQKRALERAGAAGCCHCTLDVYGELDGKDVAAALRKIVQRHEILRTSIHDLAGITVQFVGDAGGDISCRESVCLGATIEEAEQAIERMREDARAALDPSQGRVLAAACLRVSSGHSIVSLTVPAVCSDARSLKNLAAELAVLLDSGALPEPSAQYVDFSEWQNELIQAGDVGAAPYHAPQPQRLPFERPAGHSRAAPRQVRRLIDADAWARLQSLSKDEGLPADAMLLGCWQIVLSRYAGSPETTVDFRFHGRKFAELDAALGPFARYVPLAAAVEDDVPVIEILRRASACIREAGERLESIPFTASHAPGVGFEFEDAALPVAGLRSFQVSVRSLECEGERFRLKLACLARSTDVAVTLQYDAEQFDERDIRGLADSFAAVLADVLANPVKPVSHLELISREDQSALVNRFAAGEALQAEPATVFDLFQKYVRLVPSGIALRCGSDELTYAELDARAAAIAGRFVSLLPGPESIFAILLERSADAIAAMLAAWKAGGAFVVLDPGLPRERIAVLLNELRPAAVVTRERFSGKLAETAAVVVTLDADAPRSAEPAAAREQRTPGLRDLAYVLFTSGSTGVPKPVGVEHRSLANYVAGISSGLRLEGGESFAAISTLSADLGYTAVFGALAKGGCLHLVPEEMAFQAAALAEYFAANPVDCLKITPSHLNALLACAAPERLLPRKRLVLGGEPCEWRLVETLRRLAPGCMIVNHYGPTETTIGVLTYAIAGAGAVHGCRTVPVGRPLPNVEAYVLDTLGRPVPHWVPGELHIGGEALSRGYLNHPELTREKFVPHPFRVGAALYRTGDRVRLLPDGNIEFLGRYDSQMKLHGYRIEPGEIEAVLRRHPAVREAAVIGLETAAEAMQLAAYVVFAEGAQAGSTELRDFAAANLPDYMAPAKIVRVEALPLTRNGKLDRAALAALPQAEVRQSFVPPRTGTEKIIAGAWRQALGIEQVGIHDNFFELGGDSILSIQIIARLNRAGLKLTAKQFFENQTVAELAAVAGSTGRAEQGAAIGEIPLTPIERWFFELDLPEPHYYNQAMFVSAAESIDPAALRTAVDAVMRHHDALRLRFVKSASGWQQHVSPDAGPDPVSFVDFSSLSAPDCRAAMESHAAGLQRSLELSSGPLMRVAVYRPGCGQPERMLVIMHHLLTDTVSWRIFFDDLGEAYRQALARRSPVLPPKTASFGDWAHALHRYADSDAARAQAGYWHMQESDGAPLPLDYPQGANTRASLRQVRIAFTAEETRHLLRNGSVALGAHINDMLLTALARAFAMWTGIPELTVEVESHGREDGIDSMDLSRTLGWFTSRYPVRLNVAGTETGSQSLAAVRRQLHAVPQNGLGYGALRYLSRTAGLGAGPRPQVSFNYLGQFDRILGREDVFRDAEEFPGPARSALGTRPHVIDVVGAVRRNSLQFTWYYSSNLHDSRTIEFVANEFGDCLRYFAAESAGHYHNNGDSELSFAGVDPGRVDNIIRRFGGEA